MNRMSDQDVAVYGETLKQRLKRAECILGHVRKLDPPERNWLMRRLAEVECVETEVGKTWSLYR